LTAFYAVLGRHGDADKVGNTLTQAADVTGDEALRLRAMVRQFDWKYRREGAACVDLQVLSDAGCKLAPCYEKVLADYLRGIVLKFRGNLEAAGAALEKAMASLRDYPHDGLLASVLDQQAALAMRSGHLGEANRLYGEAARTAERYGQRGRAATSEVNRALVGFQMGVLQGLDTDLRRAIRTLELESVKDLASHAQLILAMVQYAAGDLSGAEGTAARAVAVLRERGYWLGLGDGLILEAMLHFARGRYEQALQVLDEAEQIGRRDGFLHARCASLGWQAKCHCALGQCERAYAKASECVGLALATADSVVRHQSASLLAEASLMGMEVPRGLDDLVADAQDTVAAVLVRAARGGLPSATVALRAAAERLRAPDVGDRRAEMRVLAGLLEAQAWDCEGDRTAAARAAAQAVDEARDLGHAWLATAVGRLV
jgi:tetratricopeptide (TPR) repeat protein